MTTVSHVHTTAYRLALNHGAPKTANPYIRGTDKHKQWLAGWKMGWKMRERQLRSLNKMVRATEDPTLMLD